ncbi:serpin-Z2B [Biomphalaria glabrata]|nr:serpin-Z2B-like [Biomphalaria glabrata]
MWTHRILVMIVGLAYSISDQSVVHGLSNETEIHKLTSAVSMFSNDLYRTLAVNAVNIVYSPFSIHTALSMAYLGAREETELSMQTTLRLSKFISLESHFVAFDLINDVTQMDTVQVYVANGMWLNASFKVLQDYQEVTSVLYNAVSQNIDFTSPDGPETPINSWVANQTRNQITSFLLPNTISLDTRLILINTLYFNGTLKSPFDGAFTKKDTFTLSNGSQIETNFMMQTEEYGVKFSAVEGIDVIRIPFKKNRFAFYIALPRSVSGLNDFEQKLMKQSFDINHLFTDLEKTYVNLKMPKFKLTASIHLTRSLKDLGMAIAFGPKANFSGISDQDLFISDVVQKATIEVQEAGVTASAASGVLLKDVAFFESSVDFYVDHPFMFFLRDDDIELILVAGKLMDPALTEISLD